MNLRNKRVLVTGADGFIGSHLVEMLVARGAVVKALTCYNSFNSFGCLEGVNCLQAIEIVPGDIRDSAFCRKIAKDVEIIFHLAALIAIPFSYAAPAGYVDTNVKGTLNISNAAMENGCVRMIHTSTSEVYGSAQYVPIDEKHPLQPQSPYSASKIGADAVAMSFNYSFDLPVVVARPFNTYGPRQSARAVIPTIITQIASGCEEIRLGDVSPTRDFNYVKDICRAFIMLAECEAAVGEVVNIGSNTEVSIGDTLKLIKKLMKRDVKVAIEDQRVRPTGSEVFRLRCDNGKLKRLTEFEPEYGLERGLKKTIEWFSHPDNLKKYKPDIYNV